MKKTVIQALGPILVLAMVVAAPAALAQVETVDLLEYPPLPTVEVPTPERHVLDNGMVVILLEDHELPLITARMLIRTGARWEPEGKIGLASLTGQMLRSGGTEERPSDELDDYLEDMAASIETGIGTTVGSASLSCLKEDFPELLPVFAEVLRQPAFEEDKLVVLKNQVNTGIARQNDDAGQIASREIGELIYGADSPYARDATYETIAAIGRQDLIDWHARYYHPDRMILGLTGDFETEEALELVEEVFGDWQRGPQFDDPPVDVAPPPRPGVYYVEKNDVNQSQVRIGHLGTKRDNPDYYKIEVMNQVFGGSFAARLFNNVRSKKGLAYNVSGAVRSLWDHPGLFYMSLSTKTETTGAAIEALLEEARHMTARPPSEEEVEKAKAGILNSFVFTSDSKSKILAQQLSFEYYGYPLDWLEQYREGIEGVSTADVVEAAEKYIRPEEFSILVVGPSTGRDKPLSTYGEVTEVDITIPEPPAPEVEVTAESQQRAAPLLARVIEAIGGAERLATVRQIETRSSLTMHTPQGEMGASSTTLIALPDRFRQELKLPFGTMVQILDGDSGAMKTPQGTTTMPAERVADMRRQLQRNLLLMLRRHDAETFTASLAGSGEVEGTPVENLYVELDGDGVTLGVDPQTGRVLSQTYRGVGVTGAPGEIREVYSDYREVDGLSVPFAISVAFEGEPMMRSEVEEMEINGEEDADAFTLSED